MPKYTVKNKESGQTVTFNWNSDQPPTDSDMAEVFAASKEFKPTDIEPVVENFGGFIDTIAPKDVEPIDTEPYVRPILEYGGLTAGAIAGGTAGPVGAVAGAGLAYGIGKKASDLIYGKEQGTVQEELIGSAKDVVEGASFEAGGAIFGKLITMYGKPAANKIHSTVKRGIEKAIRPGVAKQRTAGQAKKYYEKATDAVTNIIINKNNLKLTDKSGKVVDGLPRSLKQFSESIDQTKKIIFQQYNELAGEATGQGIRIQLNSVTNELDMMLSSKPFKDMAPDAARYASSRARALASRGSYTPAEAQEAIQILNKSLESFYKNPSYETATKAAVDSLIANNLRRDLDIAISNLTGKQYQQLKNVYGALSEIERDVGHRAAIDARKNIKGLIDFSDIFAGAEVIHGIVAMDPAFIAKGMTVKAIANFYRYINNPNRIVKGMFSEVETMLTKKAIAARTIPSSAFGRALGRSVAYGVQGNNK